MAQPFPPQVFNQDFDPQTGQPVPVAPGTVRVTAPNRSAYTFTGTNAYLLGDSTVAVLDPGPDDEQHRQALLRAIGGREVSAIILTHTHRDHSALAGRLARELGAPLWFGGQHRLSRPLRRWERNRLERSCDWALVPDRVLADGEQILAGDLPLVVHATPGHCRNHLAFEAGEVLLSGDHVMGWNSTLVAVPDGSMRDYFASLDKVIALPTKLFLPGHGGPIEDGPAYARALRGHRQMRNEQVLEAVRSGASTIGAVVERIYPKQAFAVRRAARMTITAHVEYLEALGLLNVRRGLLGMRIAAEPERSPLGK